MHIRTPNRYPLIALLVVVALVACAWLWLSPSGRKLCCSSSYKTFVSPDRRFRVEVFRTSVPLPTMPGSAADAPGFVRLQTWDGKVLQEQDIDAVQLVDHIRWSPTRVDVPLIAEWPLPRDVGVPTKPPGN
ncbi:hypothetical protein [Xanthomonas medicagonis]|uniref:hypothetical protein n=1 Tax=Xanthomonas medicagonis TaxID=3160841 RepID=UPI00351291FC